MTLTRDQAFQYVGYCLDDSLNVRKESEMPDPRTRVKLVGWQCGFEPMFVAVWSYLPNVMLTDEEAEEIAIDYLREIGWFSDSDAENTADYVL